VVGLMGREREMCCMWGITGFGEGFIA